MALLRTRTLTLSFLPDVPTSSISVLRKGAIPLSLIGHSLGRELAHQERSQVCQAGDPRFLLLIQTKGESLCKWHRLVDSRTSDDGTDEGVVFPHPSDPTITLERGSMYNPATDRVEPYEEAWLDTVPPPGTQVAFLEKEDGSSFIAIIGELRMGVGRQYAWRIESGKAVYEIGLGEGIHIDLDENAKEGSTIGPWIVREFWKT